jgi:hypothetical protein
VDVENTSRSSSSTIQGPEKIGHDEVSTILPKEDEQMIIANKEKQNFEVNFYYSIIKMT